MRKHVSTDKEPVIDISGEEDTGGSTSTVFECDECEYKASLETNLITLVMYVILLQRLLKNIKSMLMISILCIKKKPEKTKERRRMQTKLKTNKARKRKAKVQ